MGVNSFLSALTGHESVILGVGSLFYITGHLVILPVLQQSRCFRESRDFNLEAEPTQTSGKINYILMKSQSNP